MKKLVLGLVGLALFGALVWLSDRVTLQGERTVYTVTCQGGKFEGLHCTGRLAPGPRYAFRASVLRHEIIYWVRGSAEPSGRYTDCTVLDRDNWSCNVQTGQGTAIAYEMKNGHPVHGGQGLALPFHDVAKWKWWVMRLGVNTFTEAGS